MATTQWSWNTTCIYWSFLLIHSRLAKRLKAISKIFITSGIKILTFLRIEELFEADNVKYRKNYKSPIFCELLLSKSISKSHNFTNLAYKVL